MSSPVAVGERVPIGSLPTADGSTIRLSAYRGKANLAIYLLPAGASQEGRELLAAVAACMHEYQANHSQPIAIIGGDVAAAVDLMSQLRLPFPLAADPDGKILPRLLDKGADAAAPAVVLTDRYGEVRDRLTGWVALSPEEQPDILERLLYLDCLCSC